MSCTDFLKLFRIYKYLRTPEDQTEMIFHKIWKYYVLKQQLATHEKNPNDQISEIFTPIIPVQIESR